MLGMRMRGRRAQAGLVIGLLGLIALAATVTVVSSARANDAEVGQDHTFVVSVVGGVEHACALTSEEQVLCWGVKSGGRLDVPAGRYRSVSAGSWHTCGLLATGLIRCWGANNWGQSDAPNGLFRAVTAAREHSCAVRRDGEIVCWGSNQLRQLEAPRGRYTKIHAGFRHTCALTETGEARCWGENAQGQAEWPDGRYVDVVTGGTWSCGLTGRATVVCWGGGSSELHEQDGHYVAISGKVNHLCGVDLDGAVQCWVPIGRGADQAGELQDPDGTYTAVGAGYEFSCAVTDTGKVRCWGANSWGQEIVPPGQYRAVSAAEHYTCAVTLAGEMSCWGGINDRRAPVGWQPAWDRAPFQAVSAAGRTACAVTETDRVVCWTTPTGVVQPITNPTPGRYLSVDVSGSGYACGITTDHNLACWGDAYSHSARDVQQALGEGSYTAVSTGTWHACAVAVDGTIACWQQVERGDPPTGRFSAVSVGPDHACAVSTSNELHCWSNEELEREHGYAETPFGTFAGIDSGARGYCGLTTDGEVECYSAVGAGSWINCDVAMPRSECEPARGTWTSGPNPPYVEVSTGTDHACALREGSELECWVLYEKPTMVPESIRVVDIEATDIEQAATDTPASVDEMPTDEVAAPVERLGRIVARQLDDGRVEFAFDPNDRQRVTPDSRFFPADAPIGRWLNSSPIVIDGLEWGRISAQRRAGGEVEFSFVGPAGERILPRSRVFPPSAAIDRWLRSSEFDAAGG